MAIILLLLLVGLLYGYWFVASGLAAYKKILEETREFDELYGNIYEE